MAEEFSNFENGSLPKKRKKLYDENDSCLFHEQSSSGIMLRAYLVNHLVV